MARPITLHFYEDPGHGWLKVPVKLLEDLQIVDRISHSSYLLGQHAYLEEDCDAGKLIEALKQGCQIYKVVKHYCKTESAIRHYYPFTAQWLEKMAKVPVEGLRLVYGDLRMTLTRPTNAGWYAEVEGGGLCYMSRRQVMEATVLPTQGDKPQSFLRDETGAERP